MGCTTISPKWMGRTGFKIVQDDVFTVPGPSEFAGWKAGYAPACECGGKCSGGCGGRCGGGCGAIDKSKRPKFDSRVSALVRMVDYAPYELVFGQTVYGGGGNAPGLLLKHSLQVGPAATSAEGLDPFGKREMVGSRSAPLGLNLKQSLGSGVALPFQGGGESSGMLGGGSGSISTGSSASGTGTIGFVVPPPIVPCPQPCLALLRNCQMCWNGFNWMVAHGDMSPQEIKDGCRDCGYECDQYILCKRFVANAYNDCPPVPQDPAICVPPPQPPPPQPPRRPVPKPYLGCFGEGCTRSACMECVGIAAAAANLVCAAGCRGSPVYWVCVGTCTGAVGLAASVAILLCAIECS